MHQFGNGILCTLSPNHNIHRENGVYQYALKSKSVLEMHFPAIWRSKFTVLQTVKKLNLWKKTAVGKSALKACYPRCDAYGGLSVFHL